MFGSSWHEYDGQIIADLEKRVKDLEKINECLIRGYDRLKELVDREETDVQLYKHILITMKVHKAL